MDCLVDERGKGEMGDGTVGVGTERANSPVWRQDWDE